MRRFLTPLLAASLAIGAAVASHAITLPTASVTVGNDSFDFSPFFVANASGFALPNNTTHTFADGSIVTLGSTVNTASSFVSYSFGVTNPAGSQTYDLNIGSGAILPKAAGSLARSTFTESGTDNTGFGGAVGPTGSQTTILQAFGDGSDLGIDLGAPLTFPVEQAGAAFSQGPLNASAGLASGISSLGLHLGITATGGGDVYSFTGRVSATPAAVPEPGALALVAGLAVPGAIGLLRAPKINPRWRLS